MSNHNNHLADETSPYLLQHANNPVDWYPWGPEALEKARVENKLILLSVGYSACHWCHMMAQESFEDPDTAAVMNALFIIRGDLTLQDWKNVLDREYRPRQLVFAIPDKCNELPGLLNEHKPASGGIAYLCAGMSCQPPITDINQLKNIMS